MKKFAPFLIVLFITIPFLNSCKKYPDGPGFSLLSRKQRLANTWHVKSYQENGVDKTADFNNVFQQAIITIDKEGGYSLKYKAFGLVDYNESGTWRFTDNDDFFETNPTNGSGSLARHEILRLKEAELWYVDTDANGTKEYHLVP
jgi:hypothetical protein